MDQINVGANPATMAASMDGATLLVLNNGDSTLSVVDVASKQETHRLTLPIPQTQNGQPTGGIATGVVVEPNGVNAWVVSNMGQIFSVDLSTTVVQTEFDDDDYQFQDLVYDASANRLIIAEATTSSIFSFQGGVFQSIAGLQFPPIAIALDGMHLRVASRELGIIGEGGGDAATATVDLVSGMVTSQVVMSSGIADGIVLGPNNHYWVTDGGRDGLVEYDSAWTEVRFRSTPDFASWLVAGESSRVLIGTPVQNRVLEYQVINGQIADLPSGQFDLPIGAATGLLIIPNTGGLLAVAAGDADQVNFYVPADVTVFTGFWLTPGSGSGSASGSGSSASSSISSSTSDSGSAGSASCELEIRVRPPLRLNANQAAVWAIANSLRKPTKLTASVTPKGDGTYEWTAAQGRVTLTDTDKKTALAWGVMGGTDNVSCKFTPDDGSNPCTATVELTVLVPNNNRYLVPPGGLTLVDKPNYFFIRRIFRHATNDNALGRFQSRFFWDETLTANFNPGNIRFGGRDGNTTLAGISKDINRLYLPGKVGWNQFWLRNPGIPGAGGLAVRLTQGIALSGTTCPAFTMSFTRTDVLKPNT